MTYLREANARPASRTPVAAPGHGAAALQSWQAAVIALLQAGRTPVAACADAHVSVRQFRESYTHDLLFRDACLAAIAAARGPAHEAPPPGRAPGTPQPDSVPAHALPAWAPALFNALLKGMSLEAAYKEAGVLAADIRRERQRNLLFRQAFQAVNADRAGGSSRKKYEPLLDRAVADAVVAARVIAPREGAPAPRADWQGALLRALRDGWPIAEATRIANIDEQAVAVERERNLAFAQACDLIAIFVPRQRPASPTDAHQPAQRRSSAAQDWPERALAAYRDGASPSAAAQAAGTTPAAIRRRQQIDQAFGAAWDAVAQQRQAELFQEQVSREQRWREQQARVVAELSADMPLEAAARAADVPLDVASVWTVTIPAVAEAYAAYQQRVVDRRRQSVEGAAAVLRGGGTPAPAAAAAGVSIEQLQSWMQSEPTLRSAAAEGERARDTVLADAFLAALAAGSRPQRAAAQVGWSWKRALHWRSEDAAFARAWQEALGGRPRGRGRSAMSSDDRTAVRREERRDRQAKALTALRGGGTMEAVEAAAGVSRTTLYTWMRQDRVFRAAWAGAAEQGRARRAVSPPAPASMTPPPAPIPPPADAREAAEPPSLDVAPVQLDAAPDVAEARAPAEIEPGETRVEQADAPPPDEQSDWALNYLAALEQRGTVAAACRAVGIAPKAVYDRWQEDPSFRAAMNAVMSGTARGEERQRPDGRREGRGQDEPAWPPEAAAGPLRWETAFLEALRRGSRVDQAARRAGVSVGTVYDHRRTNERFRAAWEESQPKGGRASGGDRRR